MACPQKPTVLTPPPCDISVPGSCYNYLANPSRTQAEIDIAGENLLYTGQTTDLVNFCRQYNTKCNGFLSHSCSPCVRSQVASPNDLGALCGCFIETDPCDSVCARGAFTVKKTDQAQCNFGGACIIDNITIGTAAGNIEQSCNCSTCECIVDRSIVDNIGFIQKCASNKCFVREIDGSMTLVPCGNNRVGWTNRKKSMFFAGVVLFGLGCAFVFMSLLED